TRDMKPLIKLAGQTLVALLSVALEPRLLINLGGADSPLWYAASWALTVIVLVGAMNAFNMLDGIDGLAGAVSAMCLAWIALAAAAAGHSQVMLMALLVLMGVLAFLYFNVRAAWRPRAVVFLGDAGSLLLGFVITV